MRRALAGLLLALLAGTGPAAAEAETDGPSWSAVGRVNRETGGFCTGTLIAPRTVLSAAHCLWNRRTARWLPPSALHFLAGYDRGAYAAHAEVARYRLAPGLALDGDGRPSDPARDWALLTLASDLGGKAGVLPFADLGDAAPGTPLLQAGYDRTRAHRLTRRAGCALVALDRARGLLLHGCASPQGSSGAPLLLERAGRRHVVALHVGSASREGQRLGLAILPPPDIVRQALAAAGP